MSLFNQFFIPSICLLVAIGCSYFLTDRVRVLALRRDILDRPNERSSHTVPTPRGGGLAVMSVLTVACIGLYAVNILDTVSVLPVLGAAVIAVLGWADDTRSLSARVRLMVQSGTAISSLWILITMFQSGISHSPVAEWWGRFGILSVVLASLYCVWMTNLYNFMDGIDGLIGVQSVVVAFGSALLGYFAGHEASVVLNILILGAAGGFLVHNWSPAKIFMGDVGSAGLGCLFALMSISGCLFAGIDFAAYLILHAAFVGDATWTLLNRIQSRKNLAQAHRSHCYQKLVRGGFSHQTVALIYAGFGLFWLTPLAVVYQLGYAHESLFMAAFFLIPADLPVGVLCLKTRAGREA